MTGVKIELLHGGPNYNVGVWLRVRVRVSCRVSFNVSDRVRARVRVSATPWLRLRLRCLGWGHV